VSAGFVAGPDPLGKSSAALTKRATAAKAIPMTVFMVLSLVHYPDRILDVADGLNSKRPTIKGCLQMPDSGLIFTKRTLSTWQKKK
jgi:hypothetical protein